MDYGVGDILTLLGSLGLFVVGFAILFIGLQFLKDDFDWIRN